MTRVGNTSNIASDELFVNKVDSNHNSADLTDTVKTFKSLKCWYTNADSLSNKFDELKSRISISNPDIVIITEVFCKSGDPIIELNIQGYTTICNNPISHHCGVCIFVNSNLFVYRDDGLCSSPFSESIWCRIPLTGKDCLLLGVIYRSPSSDVINFNHLCNLLTQVTNTGVTHLLITGDFNMPHIDWTTSNVTSSCIYDRTFLTLIEDLFLTQHVTFPTRLRSNQTPSLLDLILTNDQHMISNLTSLPPLGKSDHTYHY